jgi:pimeloyl-ACP methyl ester carboxylesterase
MARARNGKVELEYETYGDGAQAVLLVSGLGSQMTRWPVEFCDRLAARGFRVIRFDNRDTGKSTWFQPGDSYSLAEMAADGMAVLDATKVARAHIAGVSMGGMIAQRIAINHPDRTLSLTSIMSASGAPGTLTATPEAAAVLVNVPPDPTADFVGFLDAGEASAKVIGSPAYPWPEGALRERAEAEYRRAYNPTGSVRQMGAIRGDGDRTAELQALKVPTVVLHGVDDPLVPLVGGQATAAAIPGAELRVIPGMGHDLPPALYDTFIDAIVAASAR